MPLGVSIGVGLAVLILLVIVLGYILIRKGTENMDTAGFASGVKAVMEAPTNHDSGKSFGEMTEGEKVQFIIDTYFSQRTDDEGAETRTKEDEYINSLPVSDQGCTDNYDDCALWAANGECTVNPEYMLYNCAKSCKACSLTPQQKHNVTVIYNKREPARCVNHGENYPGNFPYLNRIYDYNLNYE